MDDRHSHLAQTNVNATKLNATMYISWVAINAGKDKVEGTNNPVQMYLRAHVEGCPCQGIAGSKLAVSQCRASSQDSADDVGEGDSRAANAPHICVRCGRFSLRLE